MVDNFYVAKVDKQANVFGHCYGDFEAENSPCSQAKVASPGSCRLATFDVIRERFISFMLETFFFISQFTDNYVLGLMV